MKCLKCQNDTFNKIVVSAELLDAESKYGKKKDKFQILACKKCGLTQWYDYCIVYGEEKSIRRYEKLS